MCPRGGNTEDVSATWNGAERPFHGAQRQCRRASEQAEPSDIADPKMRFGLTSLLHRTLVANGTKRHIAAAQQSVAFGGKADIRPTHRNGRKSPKTCEQYRGLPASLPALR